MIKKSFFGLLIVVISYLASTIYVISKVDSLTLSYLTMDRWTEHYSRHSVSISPLNTWIAWYVINNRSKDKFSDLDEQLGGIDGILGLNWQQGRRDTEKAMKLAKLFLDNGANVDFVDKRTGCSAIHEALGRRDKLSVEFLKANNADLHYYSQDERSPKFCQLTPSEILKRIDGNDEFWEAHDNPGGSTLSVRAIIAEPKKNSEDSL